MPAEHEVMNTEAMALTLPHGIGYVAGLLLVYC